jgi:hypothetical protein
VPPFFSFPRHCPRHSPTIEWNKWPMNAKYLATITNKCSRPNKAY